MKSIYSYIICLFILSHSIVAQETKRLEHERNMDNSFMGIAESIGYFRGVVAATK